MNCSHEQLLTGILKKVILPRKQMDFKQNAITSFH